MGMINLWLRVNFRLSEFGGEATGEMEDEGKLIIMTIRATFRATDYGNSVKTCFENPLCPGVTVCQFNSFITSERP